MTETIAARLSTDEQTARRIAAFLSETLDADEAACAAFESEGGGWEVAVHMQAAADRARLRDLVGLAAGEEASAALRFESVGDTDWVRQSLEGLTPVRAGRFLVHGSHDRERVRDNDLGIEIEAALAFGTGHHGTTRGCLMALDGLAKRLSSVVPAKAGTQRPQHLARSGVMGPGPRSRLSSGRASRGPVGSLARDDRAEKRRVAKRGEVLDIGTGSGVLAIAAAKRLTARVVASDIDRVAVDAARSNARLNRTPRIAFVHAPGAGARAITQHRPFDLVFANILLGPLTRLAVPIRRLTAPNARIVLSGLLPSHANAALACYAAQGFRLERRIPLDGWMTLVLKRGRCTRGRGR